MRTVNREGDLSGGRHHAHAAGGIYPPKALTGQVKKGPRREAVPPSRDLRNKIEPLLAGADVRINGGRPWDLRVHNEAFFASLLADGSLGLGESYMDGWWDCDRLDEFFHRILRTNLDGAVRARLDFFDGLRAKVLNLQKPSRAFQVGQRHYDIGNDVYRAMLDRRMIYSCGYWQQATSLDEAQEAKLELICRKLQLRPGMRVLDIGCGWGGTARFVAERYGAEVVGITVSREQLKICRETGRGLPVTFHLEDYRNLVGRFDRILSIGMFEHVGYKNYAAYFQVARRCLKEGGLFLLHTIGGNRSRTRIDPWIERYIFPNAVLPSARQISEAVEGSFVIEDWHSFGPHYDTTLMHWFANFQAKWDDLREEYGDRFHRMWKYYLLSCAGSFRARKNQVWQIVLSGDGVPGGYQSIR